MAAAVFEYRNFNCCQRPILARKLIDLLNILPFSISLDKWKGSNRKSYLAGVVSFINSKTCTFQSKLLFSKELRDRHSSGLINISRDTFDQINLQKTPFVYTTDNCNVMKKTFGAASEMHDFDYEDKDIFVVEHDYLDSIVGKWLRCAAHLFQLVVGDALKEVNKYTRFRRALSKCTKIAHLDQQSSFFGKTYQAPRTKNRSSMELNSQNGRFNFGTKIPLMLHS